MAMVAALLCYAPLPAGANTVEAELWNRIKDGSDVLLIETYLTAFPNGEHAASARRMLESLKKKPETAAGPATVAAKKDYLPGETGWIGVGVSTAKAEGFGAGLAGFSVGSRIDSVVRGGPAALAGIKQGDIVVAIDGKGTGRHKELLEILHTFQPGARVKVALVRAGRKIDIDLTIGGGITDAWPMAEAGDPAVQWYLALAYRSGTGVAKDPEEAFTWASRAADQGHVGAQALVGYCYDKGEGVAADKKSAAAWFEKAAAQDHAVSMHNLGTYFEIGQGGLPVNVDKAIALYRRAAAAGNDAAIGNLERLNADQYDLAEIQGGLAALGHDPGPVDGKMGSNTRAAIKAFQAEALVPIDGEPSLRLAYLIRQARARDDAGSGATPTAGASRVAASDFEIGDLDSLDSFD